MTLKKARDRHHEARELVADGIDPGEHKKLLQSSQIAESENSFSAVAMEWFIKHKPSWTAGHARTITSRLERDVFPIIGQRSVAKIGAPEILDVIRRVEDRGAIESAHRILGLCGQIMRYAVATTRADRNPCADLRGALAPVKTKHFTAITDPIEVAKLLRALDGFEGTAVVKAALRLAPLLFVRPGELRHAQWEEVDLDQCEWSFTVSKTNTQHIVPLSTQSVEILRKVHPLTCRGPFVFPSARSPRGKRPMSENAVLAALRSMGFPKNKMTGHGFRAMARTLLDEELGFPPHLIEHQLAHAVRDPLGRAYNRTAHLGERRKMMQAWADYLDQLKHA